MSGRTYQPGDLVEWTVGTSVRHGVIESIGKAKNAGIAMVLERGHAKSRPISVGRLRDATAKMRAAMIGGGDSAA